MSIVDDAARWADDYMTSEAFGLTSIRQDLIKAYLTGAAHDAGTENARGAQS